MKNLLFVCGANGIGKTSICKEIVKQTPNSAYVDSDPCRMMNPFVLSDETIPTIVNNISSLILNYMDCSIIKTVVFSYGFHGRRKEVFEMIMKNMTEIEHRFIPFVLWCGEDENIRRMNEDHRSIERIERSIRNSREVYHNVHYPVINITNLSVLEVSKIIIEKAEL
ncbi:hypothetical protein AALB39_03500 [Lachnospiraceae bacterium 54-53]